MHVPFCRECLTYGYLDQHKGDECYKCPDCENILYREQ